MRCGGGRGCRSAFQLHNPCRSLTRGGRCPSQLSIFTTAQRLAQLRSLEPRRARGFARKISDFGIQFIIQAAEEPGAQVIEFDGIVLRGFGTYNSVMGAGGVTRVGYSGEQRLGVCRRASRRLGPARHHLRAPGANRAPFDHQNWLFEAKYDGAHTGSKVRSHYPQPVATGLAWE
jgi:hypothetical protein